MQRFCRNSLLRLEHLCIVLKRCLTFELEYTKRERGCGPYCSLHIISPAQRERQRQRDTGTETERQRETETETDRETETERQRETERDRDTDRQRNRQTKKEGGNTHKNTQARRFMN